jgi:hypothetical protein
MTKFAGCLASGRRDGRLRRLGLRCQRCNRGWRRESRDRTIRGRILTGVDQGTHVRRDQRFDRDDAEVRRDEGPLEAIPLDHVLRRLGHRGEVVDAILLRRRQEDTRTPSPAAAKMEAKYSCRALVDRRQVGHGHRALAQPKDADRGMSWYLQPHLSDLAEVVAPSASPGKRQE